MVDKNFRLEGLDIVMWEKIYKHHLDFKYAYSRYRIYKRDSKLFFVTVETADFSEWNKADINWELFAGTKPFSTLKKAKWFLADFGVGNDVSTNWIEKCQLSLRYSIMNLKSIVKKYTLAILGLIGFILYYAFASEFVLGGIEAIGIDLDGEYFSILAFPLSIVLLIPLIWLDERRSKKKHRK